MGDKSQTSHAEDFRTKAGSERLSTAFSLHYNKGELWAPRKIHSTISKTKDSLFKTKSNNVWALFHQSLICFSSVSSHFKLWSLYMLLEKIRPFPLPMPFLVSSSFAKDWLPLCLPSVCLGGSSGRGHRRPHELPPWERRITGSPTLSVVSHTYGSAVLAKLVELGGCSQHEKLSQQKLGSSIC